MKNLFKSFVKGGTYYGTALYVLLLLLFSASIQWWILSTFLFAILFCFVDYFSTLGIRDSLAGESYWRNQYFLEKQSHKGTEKRYIELVQKVKDAEHNEYIRQLNKAFKEAK